MNDLSERLTQILTDQGFEFIGMCWRVIDAPDHRAAIAVVCQDRPGSLKLELLHPPMLCASVNCASEAAAIGLLVSWIYLIKQGLHTPESLARLKAIADDLLFED